MNQDHRRARINVKILCILLGIVILLGVSLVTARHVRRRVLSARDLAAGQTAYAQKDWKEAYRRYADYLGRNLDDITILKQYAHAGLSLRPLDGNKLQRAIASYRRVIQVDPNDEEAYEELAEIYKNMGIIDDLAYIAQRKLELTPGHYQATLWLADALAGQDKAVEAKELLQPFLEKLAKEPSKHKEYVQGCIRMSQLNRAQGTSGSPALSLSWLDKAIAYDPNDAEARLLLANSLRESAEGRGSGSDGRQRARSQLDVIASLDFVPPMLHLATGMEWMALGDYEQAALVLKAAEETPEGVLEEHVFDHNQWLIAKYQLASELALRQGDHERAIQFTDRILADLKEEGYRLRILPMAVNSYLAAGSVQQARQAFDEFAKLTLQRGGAAKDSRLIYLKALVADAEGKPGVVIDTLQPETINNTAQPQYWRLLAKAYQRTGKAEAAIGAMENSLRFYPRDFAVAAELARTHFTRRDWVQAEAMARHAESLDPNSAAIAALRIEAEINQTAGKTPDARNETLQRLSQDLEKWIEKEPEQTVLRILQARIALQREKPDQAEQILQHTIEICPDTLGAEMQLARLYVATERPEDANEILRAATKRHATSAEPWLLLASLHEINQNPQAALVCLREGVTAVSNPGQKRRLALQLATLELARGDRRAGIDLLKELAAQNEQDIQVRTRLLETREIREDPDTARQLIEELRQAEGDSGSLWRYHQAALWLAQNDWRAHQQDIETYLQHCIDNNQWVLPRLTLISLYQRTGDSARIEDLCRRVLAKNPQAQDMAEQLIMLLEQQGRFTEAEEVVKNYARDEDDLSRNWQIRTALRAGDPTQAIDELKRRAAGNERDIETRLLLARMVYRQSEDAEQALAILAEADAIQPQSTAVVAARATILQAEGQSQALQNLLDSHVQKTGSFASYLLRGAYALDMGRPQDAESDYQKLLTFTETGASRYILVSDYYQRIGNLDEGIRILQNGLRTLPEVTILQRKLMQALYQRGSSEDQDQAATLLSALEKAYPEDTELMQLRARVLLQTGAPQETEQAQVLLERLVKLNPTAVDSHQILISLALQKQDYELARDRVMQALGANPDNPALLAMHAQIALKLNNDPMAVHLVNTALQQKNLPPQVLGSLIYVASECKNGGLLGDIQRLLEVRILEDPNSEDLTLLKTRTLLAQNQTDRAITELETYTAGDAGRQAFGAILELTHLYLNQGRIEEGEQRIQQAAALNPRSPALLLARINLATQLHRAGKSERASTIFQELLAASPDNVMLINNYAWALQDGLQRYDEALTLVNRGLALLPNNANLLDTRGTILAQMDGRLTDAKADFVRLVEISSDDKTRQIKSLFKLGRICIQLNEMNQARQHLRQALALDSDSSVLTEGEREEIKEMLGGR